MKKYIFLVMVLIPGAAHSANTVNDITQLLAFLNEFKNLHAQPLILQTNINNQNIEITGTSLLQERYDTHIDIHGPIPREVQGLHDLIHRQNATPQRIYAETNRAIQALTNKLHAQNL